MQWKEPEDCSKYRWTAHIKGKMRHYGLSASRVKRVINAPMRVEYGVAEDTVAVMQPQSTRRGDDGVKTWTSEIWVMYQMSGKSKKGLKFAHIPQKKIVISAWRYPGNTKVGEALPQAIWDEIEQSL